MDAVTDPGDPDSRSLTAVLSPQQREQVLEFLDSAPAEIAGWAGAQADALRTGLPVSAGTVPASEPSDVAHAFEDESDDFYAGLENDDDIVHRTVSGRSRRRPGAAAGVPVSDAPTGQARVFTMRFALVVALLAGILGGVWYAAQPRTSTAPEAATPTLGAPGPSETDVLARIAELEAKIEADPGDIDARLELGVAYFNQRQTDRAHEQWLAVTELAPDNATAWYNLGFYYLTIVPADMPAAQAAWQRVIEIDPDSDMARTASMHLAGLADPSVPSPTPTEGP